MVIPFFCALMLPSLLVYVIFTKETEHWLWLIIVPTYFSGYVFLVEMINKTAIIESDKFLKENSKPLPWKKTFGSIQKHLIEDFYYRITYEQGFTFFKIQAKLSDGKSITIFKTNDWLQAFESTNSLLKNFQNGKILKKQEQLRQKLKKEIKDLQVNNLKKIGIDDLSSKLRSISNDLMSNNRSQIEKELMQVDLLKIIHGNEESFFKTIKSFSTDESDLLHEIYMSLALFPDYWEDFLLKEIDRLFQIANDSNDPKILESLKALSTIDEWKYRSVHANIVNKIVSKLENPNEHIRSVIVDMLVEFADLNKQGTINRLHYIIKTDRSSRVRFKAHKGIKNLGKDNIDTGLLITDKLKALFSKK